VAENGTRTERLLALLVLRAMNDMPAVEKAEQLERAGFTHPEIAKLLGTTAHTIAQGLYSRRKSEKPKPSARARVKTKRKGS